MRYKVWRSNKNKSLHLLCAEGSGAFNSLPTPIRHLGPWTGGAEGEANQLRRAYRVQLAEQGFVVIYAHVAQLQWRTSPACTQPTPSAPSATAKRECRRTTASG